MNNEKYPLALPEGTILAGQYIIKEVLGQGGFGITYMAIDHKTEQKVAVKEFFPDTLATRTQTQTQVTSYAGERGDSFAYGKTCFLQEAETLAEFIGIEGVVRIHSYFEENGTAYFVMDFVEGTSFDKYIADKGGKISYEEAEKILVPVMEALASVHKKGIVHRDVTPDNIYISDDGTVRLLDFGAARYSLGDKSRSLDVVLKHGFAPKEQYTRHGKQGPFTDVYSLGASFYFALTGKRPPDSIDRLEEDDLVPPSSLGVSISHEKEDAILKAMGVQPGDRFQTMDAFKEALLGAEASKTTVNNGPVVQKFFTAPTENASAPATESAVASSDSSAVNVAQNVNAGQDATVATKPKKKKKWLIPVIIATVLLVVAGVFLFFSLATAGIIAGSVVSSNSNKMGAFDQLYFNNAVSRGEANYYKDEVWYFESGSGLVCKNAKSGKKETVYSYSNRSYSLWGICPTSKNVYFIEGNRVKILKKSDHSVKDVDGLKSYNVLRLVANENGCFFVTDDNRLRYYSWKKGLRPYDQSIYDIDAFTLVGDYIYFGMSNGYKIGKIKASTFGKKDENPEEIFSDPSLYGITRLVSDKNIIYFGTENDYGENCFYRMNVNDVDSAMYSQWSDEFIRDSFNCYDGCFYFHTYSNKTYYGSIYKINMSDSGWDTDDMEILGSTDSSYGGILLGMSLIPEEKRWYTFGFDTDYYSGSGDMDNENFRKD